ncbi:indolepyruvate ferredoxin oxidoreductase family protein [Actinospica durhamensis]|uniref:Indolepyruvate ferredoxin oxidoreductase family protein n=1 Tax=Actinospica durhamensis TaxID=1508375 RepID=A0A941ENW8_9ACTN|nr:indolepyruvate ferredoxin oxidoreductase family protein [Actinospica durhamensis]MBR7834550.1 indolepyruvate ferredoxin oxidoreductase family protein [Actinospica durhamensis]
MTLTSERAQARTPGSRPRLSLDDRYELGDGTVYLSGIHALVRLVCDRIRHDRDAGANTAAFVSGYEGSPLAGFDLELGRRGKLLERYGIVHRPGLNEEIAATSVMGTQLAFNAGAVRADGVLGVWYGKAPGLDRATDALRHANFAGTHPRGGALALVGDDPAAKSSSVPSASESELADLGLPVFYPADPQDVLDLAPHAIELSRASGLWTALKIVTNVADAAGTARVHGLWQPPTLEADYDGARPYAHKPSGVLLGASLTELERSFFTVRQPLALHYLRASGVNRIVARTAGEHDRIGIIASGKPYLDLRQALGRLGLDESALARHGIRILKLGAIHPVEPSIVREFARGLGEIIVVEEKRAFVETAVKDILYGLPDAPAVYGKHDAQGRTLFATPGELDPDAVAAGLARVLGGRAQAPIAPVEAWLALHANVPAQRRGPIALPLLPRTPHFCSGCPHNASTKVPEGTVVGAGIGCHTMTVLMRPEQVGAIVGLTQMGGEGAQWIGMSPFSEHGHFVQNIGDGTFMHSGSLAVRAAVAAGVNITFKLLHNSVVAMTGGQQAVGVLPLERIVALLLVEGAAQVVITSDEPRRVARLDLPRGVQVRDRADLIDVQRELAAVPGVTVLIHDQECATEKRRSRRRGQAAAPQTRVLINERVCEGCNDCGTKSNCLSVRPVETEFGRKTRIDQSSCNLDYSCVEGDCPSFLNVVAAPRSPRRVAAELAAEVLPEPAARPGGRGLDAPGGYSVRITGIGGTGVVTVAQILAAAAVVEQAHVRVLDQTGLAQKGGAVVSDVKITRDPLEQAAKLAAGQCDLYLACDQLVAADEKWLAAASADRTTSVVSTAQVPTGRMISDPATRFPAPGTIRSSIDTASAHSLYLDAQGLAEALFDDTQQANLVQLGAAYQSGAIPLPAEAIEEAIALNGIAVQRNTQAFRRGRQLVADPEALQAELDALAAPAPVSAAPRDPRAERELARLLAVVDADEGSELARVLGIRVPELVAYQNPRYAQTYVEFVEEVRRVEGGRTQVTEAVARNLHKLMAYKDEYEVARLSLSPELRAQVEGAFGQGAQVAFRLHPPVLRALGLKRKIALKRTAAPAFRALHALRALRGTRLDPFGYAKVRRVERDLPEEYRTTVLDALKNTDDGETTRKIVLELAELPDLIRGYEEIKLANVARYQDRRRELISELEARAGDLS